MNVRGTTLAILGFALGFACAQGVPDGRARDTASSSGAVETTAVAPAAPVPLPAGITEEERRDIDVFRRASSSVVFITSIALQRDYFSLDVMKIPQGNGSGFVWDRRGHIVTNYHVIQNGSEFSVRLADQSEWPAKVIGSAPEKDLAVLRIDAPAERLIPLPVGASSDLLVGQRVLALGNPFGLDHTLTVGVVSALGRELDSPGGRTIRDVIQTDAAINPGNSGGPLLDSSGRVVGMNSAIYSPSGASAGIGFAVPIDTIARLVPPLIKNGRVEQPGIGINILQDRFARRLGIEAGVVVAQVEPGTPAAKAGLEGVAVTRSGRIASLGDVIVAVDGKGVRDSDDLFYAFEDAGVGADVTLTLERDGQRRDVRTRLVAVR